MRRDDDSSMGYIVEYPQANLRGASEEHGHLDLSACTAKPQIGDRVQVLPVHPCPCVRDRVEAVWPVHARGRIR